MLIPSVANVVTQFYPVGNTPAVSLTSCLPQGEDGDILLLGCGDLRNILYTAYCESGLPSRNLDFTCCDYIEDIHARNVVLLTLIIDGSDNLDAIWSIYYDLYLGDADIFFFRTQTMKLLKLLDTLDGWREGTYGKYVRFCDEATFSDFRAIISKYVSMAVSKDPSSTLKAYQSSLARSVTAHNRTLGGDTGRNVTALRSAAPLLLDAYSDLPAAFKHYWDSGTTSAEQPAKKYPNPMFAATVCDSPNVLVHYGTDPRLGFHLATAYADLSEASPLRPDGKSTGFKSFDAARTQFFAWVKAFRAIKDRVVVRFVTADALAFTHTLQNRLVSTPPAASAHWFRRQFEARKLEIEPKENWSTKNSRGVYRSLPLTFDVIDTSNLADHLGTLNLLVATAPLLSGKYSSTIQTELLLQRGESETDTFGKLLYGHAPTISLLLGLSPAEYYTNATTASLSQEFLFSGGGLLSQHRADRPKQLRSRMSWKLDSLFAGLSESRSRVGIVPADLAAVFVAVYKDMFTSEKLTSPGGSSESILQNVRNNTYSPSHQASFVAFMKAVTRKMDTDWPTVYRRFMDVILQNLSNFAATQYVTELAGHLHMWDVHTEARIEQGRERDSQSFGGFNAWKSIPGVVAVTVVMPRAKFNPLFEKASSTNAAPTFLAGIKSGPKAAEEWHEIFPDVHLVFGRVITAKGSRDDDSFALEIEQDKEGWAGNAPVITSFYAPTFVLQFGQRTAAVGLTLLPTPQNMMFYDQMLGEDMLVFETTLGDESRVYVTKHMPGHDGYSVVSPSLPEAPAKMKSLDEATFTANIDRAAGRLVSITGRMNVRSQEGKALLANNKVPVELRHRTPFVVDIVFGKNLLALPVHFTVPVSKTGALIRIERKSSFVEVTALPASPLDAPELADFMFPTTLPPSGPPATLAVPHLNLDTLPVLDLSDTRRLHWLATVASSMFSDREHREREARQHTQRALTPSVRVNFKESLFSIFTCFSGLQDCHTGLFGLSNPDRGGLQVVLVVSALRLDGPAGSIVADAAVLPLMPDRMRLMGPLTAGIGDLALCNITVDDAEQSVWERALPAFAERARTWSHLPSCAYAAAGAAVPRSLAFGAPMICACGEGRLPQHFFAIPGWREAAHFATRIAISPTFAVPFVEEVVDRRLIGQVGAVRARAAPGPSSAAREAVFESVMRALEGDVCRNCGAEEAKRGEDVPLKQCTRCLGVSYCSARCKKEDWRRHKRECMAAEPGVGSAALYTTHM